MSWSPLHCHTYYSLLDGLSRPRDIAAKCAALGYPAVAMTDHGNVSGAIEFVKAVRGRGLRPILGCELYICDGDAAVRTPANGRPYHHLVVLARNLKGWRQLLRAVSRSGTKEYAYYHPRLHMEALREFAGDLIAISGHPGSELANVIFTDPKAAYACGDYATVKARYIRPDAGPRMLAAIDRLVSIFGRENVRLEGQVLDPEAMPASLAILRGIRWAAGRTGIPVVATADSHYVDREDAYDQQVLLCSKLRTTFARVRERIARDEDVELGGFFRADHFHIPTPAEMGRHHTPEEIAESLRVAAMCEDYDILSPPRLPEYPCPAGSDAAGHLRQLCEDGFRAKIEPGLNLAAPVEAYRERLDREFAVIVGAGLSPYFLIVQDVMNFSRARGRWLGRGRGSGAGCLVSYLIGITGIDPLRYGLLFERFYNAGRNAPGHVSMPDIDLDFPATEREPVFNYLRGKYGADRVAKIATFQTMAGRSALDEVMSAHEVDFELRKQITKLVPDTARISEELQQQAERGEEPSAIRYALEVFADELSEWATLRAGDDEGGERTVRVDGQFGAYFAQAMRIEGTKKCISTHAAGIVIADRPLAELCPLKYDDGAGCHIAAMEYPALEAMGLMKLDALGVTMLDKGELIRDLVRHGEARDHAA